MTHVSRLPPPWELLTTREPGLRATRVRPPGRDVDLGAGQYERAQVLVGAAKLPAVEYRLDGQGDHRLCDEGAWPRLDAQSEQVPFLLGRGWAHEHAVASRSIDSLDHQFLEMV